MPSLHDVKRYLCGLWLLVKGDARGLSAFDISDRGVLRSFWAVVWCLPAFAVYAVLRRIEYAYEIPDGEISALSFHSVLFGIEVLLWALSVIILAGAATIFRLRPLIRTFIVLFNWSSVPIVYLAYGVLFPIALFPLQSNAFDMQIGLAQIVLLICISLIVLLAVVRALRIVMGGHPFKAIAIVALVTGPTTYVADLLEKEAGIFISYE